MKLVLLLGAVLVALVLMLVAQPVAAAACGPTDIVQGQLAERYGETRQGAGLAANGTLVEVWASGKGSWTITVTTADRNTCLVASGQSWESINEPPAPLGVPG